MSEESLHCEPQLETKQENISSKSMSTQNLPIATHSSITHNNPKVKQFKCPSADEWKNKMGYIPLNLLKKNHLIVGISRVKSTVFMYQ